MQVTDVSPTLVRLLRDNGVERDRDDAGLRAGKFCEALLRFLQELTGQQTPFAQQIPTGYPSRISKPGPNIPAWTTTGAGR